LCPKPVILALQEPVFSPDSLKSHHLSFWQRICSRIGEEMAPMSRTFMAPLRTFTLESLVALERWSAEQSASRRKSAASRARTTNGKDQPVRPAKPEKIEV
jgi:hypothetical protein